MKKWIRIFLIGLFVVTVIYAFFTQFIPFIKIGFTKNIEPTVYEKYIQELGCNINNKTSKDEEKEYFYYETDDNCPFKAKYISAKKEDIVTIYKELEQGLRNNATQNRGSYRGKLQVINYYSQVTEGKDYYVMIYNKKRIIYFKSELKDKKKITSALNKMGYAILEQKERNSSLIDWFQYFFFY